MDNIDKHKRFWPSTFEERGAAVPFTTPMLNNSRVRLTEKESLELMVAGLSGGAGVYVIGWTGLEQVFSMTVHDRILHKELLEGKAATPFSIRKISMKVAASGLAGPGLVERAKAIEAEEEGERLITNFMLVSRTVEQVAKKDMPLTLASIGDRKGQQRTKTILSEVAGRFSLNADQLYARLEEWSDLVAPAGLPSMPRTSRLRQLQFRLRDFIESIGGFALGDKSDAGPIAQLAADVAERTLQYTNTHMAVLDDCQADISGTLQHWFERKNEMAKALLKLEWLLDGWDPIMCMWLEALDGDRYLRQDTAIEIGRQLPMLPRNEIEEQDRKGIEELIDGKGRLVKPLESWMTGQMDLDLVLRVERTREMTK